MQKNCLALSVILIPVFMFAQPLRIPTYTIDQIQLPGEMNKQVCISGMNIYKDQLYFASERCPFVIVFDPAAKSITRTINMQVGQEFEMEGMTIYNDKLYLISENVAALYEVKISDGSLQTLKTSIPLPAKTKNGDGMEGIAANEKHKKFYLLRERNEEMTRSQFYTFNVKTGADGTSISLEYESMFELPLDNPQWRYSDICLDAKNNKLICLKSYSKGKTREQYLESINLDETGKLLPGTLQNIPVNNFTELSNTYKDQDYSMNLEGVTIAADGTIYIVSDNTSGKADCSKPAREKTVLLELKKN